MFTIQIRFLLGNVNLKAMPDTSNEDSSKRSPELPESEKPSAETPTTDVGAEKDKKMDDIQVDVGNDNLRKLEMPYKPVGTLIYGSEIGVSDLLDKGFEAVKGDISQYWNMLSELTLEATCGQDIDIITSHLKATELEDSKLKSHAASLHQIISQKHKENRDNDDKRPLVGAEASPSPSEMPTSEAGPSCARSLQYESPEKFYRSLNVDFGTDLEAMKNILEAKALEMLAEKRPEINVNPKQLKRLDIFLSNCSVMPKDPIVPSIGSDGKTFKVIIDVSFFSPECITVHLVNDVINVFAAGEYETSNGYDVSEFHSVYDIPDYVNEDQFTAHILNPLQLLCICAPVKELEKEVCDKTEK